MDSDEPHLTLNEKNTKQPTGALVADFSLWPSMRDV